MIIYGRNSVLEALIKRPQKFNKLYISKTSSGKIIKEIIHTAKTKKVLFEFVDSRKIDKLVGDKKNHQGIAAAMLTREYVSLEDLIEKVKKVANPTICILDGITDPQNLGAILRNACYFDIIGVIIPRHNSVGLTDTVFKVSSGAAEYVYVARVSNINYTIDELKKNGFWIVGADSHKGEILWEAEIPKPTVIVLGSEGYGLKRLVKENCDVIVRIPQVSTKNIQSSVTSLNVGSFSAIIFCEISRRGSVKNETTETLKSRNT